MSRIPANTLYLGDNLQVLRRFVADQSVDLIYLDPPFNSDQDYYPPQPQSPQGPNESGRRNHPVSPHRSRSFSDVWRWDSRTESAFKEATETSPSPVSRAMRAFRELLGPSGMLAYLAMMAPRLVELRRALKPTGSIYLHCDRNAGAHLRLLMDAVFGAKNFLNDIAWCYGLGGSSRRRWPRKHDRILWYSRLPNRHHFQATMVPATSQRMKGLQKKAPDYWIIPSINNMARERLGYPTQKPEALLERIIASSSRPGDLVLDPFCGSGTAPAVAQKLNRRWIAVDCNPAAIEICRRRLKELAESDITVVEL